MRVVHVFKDFYPPTTGGVEQHMRVLCAGLAPHVSVSVLVPSRSTRRVEEAIDGVHVVRTPELGRWLSTPLCPGMTGELRRLSPDLVHLHFPNPMGDAAYLLSASRAPVVMTYHADIVRLRPFLWGYRPLFRRLAPHLRRIIVASHEYLRSSAFLSPYREQCAVIPFGIEPRAFVLEEDERAAVRRLRARYGGRLALFVGVLRSYKGLHVLIEAMASVSGHLLVAGRGPYRATLEQEVRRRRLADRVTLLGEVSDAERRVLLHACDVFVLPSIDRSEAFGIAQLEAMACGKPVVSSDLPTGMRAVNRHGLTGLRVPPGDAAALAAALNAVLGDDALRVDLGRRARERVEQEFTADRMVARTLALYDDVLARSTDMVVAAR